MCQMRTVKIFSHSSRRELALHTGDKSFCGRNILAGSTLVNNYTINTHRLICYRSIPLIVLTQSSVAVTALTALSSDISSFATHLTSTCNDSKPGQNVTHQE